MNTASYSTVTVVYGPELKMLKAQAHSMKTHWHCTGIILVIVNDSLNVMNQIDKSWWGPLEAQVKVVHHSHWFDNLLDTNFNVPLSGWVIQQILKILGTATNTSDWSIVLDAKNIFVRDIYDGDYLIRNKIQANLSTVKPVFYPSKLIVDKLFDINFQIEAGTGTPRWLSGLEMRQMIFDFGYKKLIDFWCANASLTEFILHDAYIQYKYGSIENYYQNSQEFSTVNIAHYEVRDFESKYEEMYKDNILSVSIHRDAWEQLQPNQKKRFNSFLKTRGLIGYDFD